MGVWTKDYNGVEVLEVPKTKYQNFVHMCDYLASKKFLNIPFDKDNNISAQALFLCLLGLFKFKLFVIINVEGTEKDMKNDTRRMFSLGLSVVIVLLLVVFVIYVSYLIINNIYNDPILKVNKKTANYISFLFEDNNGHIIEVKNPKIVNDEIGKLLFGEDVYT